MGWSFAGVRFEAATDAVADGNNVAWNCPHCGFPVLLVYQSGRRGSSQTDPANCECGRRYYLSPPYGSRPEPPAGQSEAPANPMRILEVQQ